MTEADIEGVIAIELASFDAGDIATNREDARAAREKQLREELARPWARLRVARDPSTSQIVGYVLFWHVSDEIHLLNVAAAPTYRRRGIGSALVAEVLARAKDH